MATDEPRIFELRVEIDSEQLAELERALLKARATELGEVRRRSLRLTAGYGDATTRDVLDEEGRRAQVRHDALTRLLEALREARPSAAGIERTGGGGAADRSSA